MTGEIAVVGGGIIGLSIARAVAREGRRVVVFERGEPGCKASWAAAGMLAPQAEGGEPGPFLDLLVRSRGLFPRLLAELKESGAEDVGYRADGLLMLAFEDEEVAALATRVEWQKAEGLRAVLLGSNELARLESGVSRAARAGAFFPDDHQVDNRRLTSALQVTAAAAGVEIRGGVQVDRIDQAGGSVRLRLSGGESWVGERAVVAAGSWSGTIDGVRSAPVAPVMGQLLALDAGAAMPRHIVAAGRAYLVPRSDGRLIVGTTVERVGFQEEVTEEGLRILMRGAVRLLPRLADRPMLAHWAGLRPGTPDGLPILGARAEAPNVIYATGHHRNGILLAPITAEIIADLLADRDSAIDLRPYSPDRFG